MGEIGDESGSEGPNSAEAAEEEQPQQQEKQPQEEQHEELQLDEAQATGAADAPEASASVAAPISSASPLSDPLPTEEVPAARPRVDSSAAELVEEAAGAAKEKLEAGVLTQEEYDAVITAGERARGLAEELEQYEDLQQQQQQQNEQQEKKNTPPKLASASKWRWRTPVAVTDMAAKMKAASSKSSLAKQPAAVDEKSVLQKAAEKGTDHEKDEDQEKGRDVGANLEAKVQVQDAPAKPEVSEPGEDDDATGLAGAGTETEDSANAVPAASSSPPRAPVSPPPPVGPSSPSSSDGSTPSSPVVGAVASAHFHSTDLLQISSYGSKIFRAIRALFGINDNQFLRSLGIRQLLGSLLLGNLGALSMMMSEGKSGSLFFKSADGRFLVKVLYTLYTKNHTPCTLSRQGG
jgi:hypothetical protein